MASRVRERCGLGNRDVGIQAGVVHVSAGDCERKRGNEQARARNDPAIDRVADRDVCKPRAFAVDVTQSRKASFEILLRGRYALHRTKGLGLGDDRRRTAFVLGLQQDVRVAVDHPWQNRVGRQVDHACAIGDLRGCSDLFDASSVDDDDSVWSDRAVHRIEQPPAANRCNAVCMSWHVRPDEKTSERYCREAFADSQGGHGLTLGCTIPVCIMPA